MYVCIADYHCHYDVHHHLHHVPHHHQHHYQYNYRSFHREFGLSASVWMDIETGLAVAEAIKHNAMLQYIYYFVICENSAGGGLGPVGGQDCIGCLRHVSSYTAHGKPSLSCTTTAHFLGARSTIGMIMIL